jgi:hypothetical protein
MSLNFVQREVEKFSNEASLKKILETLEHCSKAKRSVLAGQDQLV